MTVKEYFELLPSLKIDNNKVSEIEKVYGTILPETVKKIVSECDESFFIDDYRVLSFDEIRDAEENLEVKFSDFDIIPLFDCGNNDFIVYHFKTEKWSLFNIVDACIFKIKSRLDELMY
ncbi:MAG: hypothetical protein PUG48_00350 [Clostridia bacterium]|nr:hypothetical protein [Clostridia bacterium]